VTKYTVITPEEFIHKFYYYVPIFIELYLVVLDHSFQCDDTKWCITQF